MKEKFLSARRPRAVPDGTAVTTAESTVPDAAIATVLAERYGAEATSMYRLGGEVDLNQAVLCQDGLRLVVKVAPPGTDLAHLRWQHELLRSLAQVADVPPVPAVLPALDGSDIVLARWDGELRPVRVHTWLPGRTLAELSRHSPDLLRDWGRAAGQLVNALPADAAPERRAATHHWEALRAVDALRSVHGSVTDRAALANVDTIMTWFAEQLGAVGEQLPHQVVHQDLNDFNVLAQAGVDGRHRLSGVLDFTDAIHTARVSELAIAVAYAMLRKPEPLLAAAEVVRGYCEVATLTDAELRILYPMATARLCVNATTWTARAPRNGAYARARMEHTWPTISRLAQLPPTLAHEWFCTAADRASAAPADALAAVFAASAEHRRAATFVGAHLAPLSPPQRRRTESGSPATLRLGIDLVRHEDAPEPPLDGAVEVREPGMLILRHGGAIPFWSRWCDVDTPSADGPTVRVCVFTDLEAARLAPRDAIPWTSAAAWRRIAPDPAPLFGLDPTDDQAAARTRAQQLRGAHFARSQRSYYDTPPRLVGSRDVWLYDDRGLAYLDAINNVSHVGHANPRVVEAAHAQAQTLNTNSRFVYDGIGDYASRLAGLLPDPLEVVFLVCTGSEANDLALRIARQVTGREGVLVIDGAYHGNTTAVTAISPNRYKGPGGTGAPPTTHEVVQPNRYRGPHGYDDPDAGTRYAADVARVTHRLAAEGRPPAAFIAESLMGTAGAIIHPPGYLAEAFQAVRSVGGLCISDEVQVGFGRLGSDFWGFQAHGVVPDIVTMGKPIGNGHPMAAVITTRAIAEAFDTGMKYFNTFGGNPVSCAIGMAVLDEIDSRGLQGHAAAVGDYFLDRLRALQSDHPLIGDVRGHGLYLGIELVTDPVTRHPAGEQARYLSERMKDEGVLVYPTGAGDNVLKIKPPMTFTREHVDVFADTLDAVLSREW
jgi:4-aminobutyrate aminotransferase-like enzyme/Ser/Thr protein kinase RdoA (MazF antagonist)